MKKGDGPNSGVEFFYKLSLNPEFQNDLARARKQLGIKLGHYSKHATRKIWVDAAQDRIMELLAIELELKEKYNIPAAYWWEFLDDYIFFGRVINAAKHKPPVAVIDRYANMTRGKRSSDIEEFYRETKEPYVKLFILGNANKTSVLDYINKNWNEIEELLDTQRGAKSQKVRAIIYKDRNSYIKELCRKPSPELRELAGIKSTLKDTLIAKILEKGGYGKIADGYIRKICSQK